MTRRRFLGMAAALGTCGAGVTAWKLWPAEGVFNPCLGALPPRLAEHELVRAAWEGIAPAQVWDGHAHLLGSGDSGGGAWLNPAAESVAHPVRMAQRRFFLNAACARDAPGEVDRSYVEHMRALMDGMPPGAKMLLLAFDQHYTERGETAPERTDLHIPNRYARALAQRHPDRFEWAASVHPYRRDCVAELEHAARGGARAVKWLPAMMGIDPASSLCDSFYAALARLDLPLITHAGEERAALGGAMQAYGNPLLLRRALDHGVRVVVAHCASMGEGRDLDRGPQGPLTDNFELFARLMDMPAYERRLYGDISSMLQTKRAGPALARVIERSDWQTRLLNGSDYPLPGVMPLYSVETLVERGYIERAAAPVLIALRRHNPLLFDFVAKRHLRSAGRRLGAAVFETRKFFTTALMPGP